MLFVNTCLEYKRGTQNACMGFGEIANPYLFIFEITNPYLEHGIIMERVKGHAC